MCGRITQHRTKQEYAQELGWEMPMPQWIGGNRVPHYNLPPGTVPMILHTLHERKQHADFVPKWGYRPTWAKEKGLPQTINARLETATTKPYFRHMFAKGRILVPADGWYEWTGEKGNKQPWYIRLKSDRPMFLAAITNWVPCTVQDKEVGLVIVTAAADGGLVDVHDRRPVVFGPEDANLWIDNALPAEQADMLARNRSLPPESFEWYQVSKLVNTVQNDSAELINPI